MSDSYWPLQHGELHFLSARSNWLPNRSSGFRSDCFFFLWDNCGAWYRKCRVKEARLLSPYDIWRIGRYEGYHRDPIMLVFVCAPQPEDAVNDI